MSKPQLEKNAKSFGDLHQYLRANLEHRDLTRGIVRYATHEFWGTTKQLLKLYAEKGTVHTVQQMVLGEKVETDI